MALTDGNRWEGRRGIVLLVHLRCRVLDLVAGFPLRFRGRGDRVRHDGEGVVGAFGVRATQRSGESNFFATSSASLRSVVSGSWYRHSLTGSCYLPQPSARVIPEEGHPAESESDFRDTPDLERRINN